MNESSAISRRTLLRAGVTLCAAAACPHLIACAADTGTSPVSTSADDAVNVLGTAVEIDTRRVPQWGGSSTAEQAVVFLAAQIIVVRRGNNGFAAFSAECPHSGCGVSIVQRSSLICPCHGSEFDFEGRRLGGPAPTGLTPLASSFDPSTRRLRVERSTG